MRPPLIEHSVPQSAGWATWDVFRSCGASGREGHAAPCADLANMTTPSTRFLHDGGCPANDPRTRALFAFDVSQNTACESAEQVTQCTIQELGSCITGWLREAVPQRCRGIGRGVAVARNRSCPRQEFRPGRLHPGRSSCRRWGGSPGCCPCLHPAAWLQRGPGAPAPLALTGS